MIKHNTKFKGLLAHAQSAYSELVNGQTKQLWLQQTDKKNDIGNCLNRVEQTEQGSSEATD